MITKKDITKMIDALKTFDPCAIESISTIIWGLQQCKKLRISSISAALHGKYESNYKSTTRALNKLEVSQLSEGLLGFLDPSDNVVLLDFTEMTRKNADRTDYVGYLKDGETLGYGY